MERPELEPQPGTNSSTPSAPDLSASQSVPTHEREEEQYITVSQTQPSVPPVESASQDPYPQWIYGALISPEASAHAHIQAPSDQQVQGPQGEQLKAGPPRSGQTLQEEEIRQLFTDYVDQHCGWGAFPAHKWAIEKVEDFNVYIGSLETFFEEREVVQQVTPYAGSQIDDNNFGHPPGAWEVDMRTEFPPLFSSRKQSCLKLPHSESVDNCPACSGRKEVPCPVCTNNLEPGSYVPGQTSLCPHCHGRGLLAHQDGSDSKCLQCQGNGRLPCAQCNSRGLLTCVKCCGSGAWLFSKLLTVTWSTLLTKKTSAPNNVLSIPDEVFHEAKGVQLYNSQSYQCHPVSFPHSHELTKLSSDTIAERAQVPPAARVICERHQIHLIPVTRVLVAQGKSSLQFYIVGLSKHIYLKDYPSRLAGPGVLVGAALALSCITALTFLWKLTRRRQSKQFIVRH